VEDLMLISVALSLALVQQQAPSFNEITIYNQGFALVKEDRVLPLKTGRQTIAIENVAAQIEPSSVGFHSITNKDSFQVLEQNYQFDLISPIAILNKAVGSKIRFIRVLPNATKEILTGTLVSSPTAVVGSAGDGSYQTYNGLVMKTDDGRIVLNPTGEIEVDSIPEGLISRPTLLWDIQASQAGDNTIELSYLTQGMNWNADYVLTLDGGGKSADLQGWVTLTNQAGATFKNTRLKLLAGDVNRAQDRAGGGIRYEAAAPMANKSQFQEQTLFEYHLYTLERPTTLRDKEIKQVSLLEGHGVPYEKKLIIDATRSFGRYYPGEGEVGTGDIKPQVRVEFVNSKASGLGMPLPKGKIKVYQRDNSGAVQMLGEDQIDHTPRDERLSIILGRSFDIVANRKRTNFRQLSPHSVEETFQIEVRNHKDTPETVTVIERPYWNWKITSNSQQYTKLDSDTIQFVLDLKAGETRTVSYTVVTTWE
jgi:hypothetical protein